ncbi:MAG: ATP-binding cassette domain-containing protein [Gammaproteobacteria bacterium]
MTDVLLDVAIRVELLPFELELKATFQHAVTGIYAPSGSGKTSFLRCLAGLQRRVNGHIFFNNQVWLDSKRHINRPPEKRHIGYVPQDGLLFPHKNVRQNLQIGARRAHHKVSLSSVCELLELAPLLDRAVNTLSGIVVGRTAGFLGCWSASKNFTFLASYSRAAAHSHDFDFTQSGGDTSPV